VSGSIVPTIALCGRLDHHGFDVDRLLGLLARRGVGHLAIDDLCRDPRAFHELGERDDETRVVAAVCPDGPSHDEIRARARRAGLDPGTGAIRVDLSRAASYGPPEDVESRALAILLAAAASRAETSRSPADGLRLGLPTSEVSRRSFFSLARASYVPVAVVGQGGCRGSAVCGLCVEACPVDAIEPGGRVPRVDKARCIGCAACVTACPVDDAVRLPGDDLAGFEVGLRTLVEERTDAGVLVSCRSAPPTPDARVPGTWLPIEVPCLSIVTPGWALEVLRAGAPAVAFRGCGDRCGAGAPARLTPRIGFVRSALDAIGVTDPGDRVRLVLPPDEDAADPTSRPEDLGSLPIASPDLAISLREPAASATLLTRARAQGKVAEALGSPLGIVTVRAEGCTLCGLCAQACPTGAFGLDEGPLSASLDLVPERCVGCGHCVTICPEKVIDLEPGVDLGRLGGHETIKRAAIARCTRCGEPIANAAMLERIRAMLPDDPAVTSTIGELCMNCRGY